MYKKGFMTGYYLLITILIFDLIALSYENNRQEQIAISNIQTVREYLGIENYVIRTIQSYLEEEIDLEYLQFDSLSYQIKSTDSPIHIELYEPVHEVMIVYLDNHKVYDYETIRFEKAFQD